MSDNKCPNCGAPFERVIRSPFQEGKGVHYLCGTAQWPNGLANENNLICRYINALRTKLDAAQQRVEELENLQLPVKALVHLWYELQEAHPSRILTAIQGGIEKIGELLDIKARAAECPRKGERSKP